MPLVFQSGVRFQRFLELALASRGKSYINPLRISFRQDGAYFEQTNESHTIAILGVVRPDFFQEYSPIGDIIIDVDVLYEVVSDHFKKEVDVSLSVEDGKLLVESSSVRYRADLLSADIPEVDKSNIRRRDGVIYIETDNHKLRYIYRTDATVFKDLKKKWEIVGFRASDKGLVMLIDTQQGHIERSLPVRKEYSNWDGEISFKLPVEVLQRIGKAYEHVYISVSASDDGEPAPVGFQTRTEQYDVGLLLLPMLD